jgi:hypothetical protein
MVYIKFTTRRENMFRTNRQCRLFAIAFCLALCLTMATSIRVKASSQFDGTYSYSYTYDWAGSWSTRDLGDVFIVSNGQISMSGSSDFYGSVDSNGLVSFIGPSPLGGEQATFSGSISSSGSGGGTWNAPSGTHGNWNVTLVSGGGSGSFVIGGDTVSWSIAAVAGTVVFGSLIATYRHNVARNKKNQAQVPGINQPRQERGSYTAQPADNSPPPPPPLPPPLNPIGGDGGGYHLEDYGVVRVAPPEASALPYMNANWFAGGVSLAWGRPQYDPSKYKLIQFDISQMTYGPNSTVPQPTAKTVVVDDGRSTAFTENRFYGQTYTNSTGGDVAGFRVDPLFQDLQTGRTFHTGGLGVKIGQALGTYGIGP